MDKEMIEKIAIEEYAKACAVKLTRGAEATAIETCKNFLARIDAERGKEAVFSYDGQSGEELAEIFDGYDFGTKFYAAQPPEIPEGMALVPIEPTQQMVIAGCQRMFDSADPTTEPYNIYVAMLAAAQGERNAD